MVRILPCLSILFLSLSISAEVVQVDIGDWEPYTSSKDPNGRIAETIATEAFKLVGYEVKINYYPWKRSYENVMKGRSDVTYPWFSTEERASEVIVSKEPLLAEKEVFFYLKDTAFDWNTFEDLKKYKIGGTVGYSHVSRLEKHGIKLITVGKEDVNFKKIMSGRLDAYPASLIPGQVAIKKLFTPEEAEKFTYHKKPTFEDSMYALFSKNKPNGQALSDKFDEGLKQLKKSGRYDEILNTK